MTEKNEVVKVEKTEITKEEYDKLVAEYQVKAKQALKSAKELVTASVYALLKQHGFLGHLMQMLNRCYTTEIPTAAVGVDKTRYYLFINPFFYSELSHLEAKDVLAHELYHLLNQHLSRGKDYDQKLFNAAADLAINCHLHNLPKLDREETKQKLIKNLGMTEEQADRELPKADKDGKSNMCLKPADFGFPDFNTAEWYYHKMLNNKELREKFGKQKVSLFDLEDGKTNLTPEQQEQLKQDIKDGKVRFSNEGDHSKWEKSQGDNQQLLDEELRRMIKDAMNKDPVSFGNMPGNMKEEILKFLNTEINWKQKLRQFIQVATEIIKKRTRKRASRRYGITYPGRKSDYKLNIGIIVDSSGSISDNDLSLFGGEINAIFGTQMANIEIMVGDTQINDHYPMKKKMEPKDFKVTGRGGTTAKAWLDYAAKHEFDVLICLTDGCFFDTDKLKKPRPPILWALTVQGLSESDFKQQVKFGRTIKLKKALQE